MNRSIHGKYDLYGLKEKYGEFFAEKGLTEDAVTELSREEIENLLYSEQSEQPDLYGENHGFEKPFSNKIKKRKKRRKKRPFLKLFIFLLLIGATIFYISTPKFSIKYVDVKGNHHYSKATIKRMAKVPSENLFFTSMGKIEKRVERDSYIENCKISRKLPNRVVMRIKERRPAASVIYGKRYVIIDKNGYILRISEKRPGVTVIYGAKARKVDKGKKLVTVNKFLLYYSLNIIDIAEHKGIHLRSVAADKDSPVLIRFSRRLSLVGPGDNIKKHFDNGNISEILADLKKRKIKRGHLTIGKDNYCVFSPKII